MSKPSGTPLILRSRLIPLIVIALILAAGACTGHPKSLGSPSPSATSVSPTPSAAAPDPASCTATTSWDDQTSPSAFTARLVGSWQLCHDTVGEPIPSSLLLNSGLPGWRDPGIEFTADHHWFELEGNDPLSFTRKTGPDNEGSWAQRDQSGPNKHWPWQVLMRIGQRGTGRTQVLQNSVAFAKSAPKMQLGSFVFVKLLPADSQTWPDLTPSGFMRRAGVQAGFAIDIPKDWKGGWFEGTWDFEPKGLPSTSEDGRTFALTVTVQPGRYQDAFPGATTTPTVIEGRNAVTASPDGRHVFFAVDWNMCANYARRCSTADSTRRLIMRLSGSTDALWAKYLSVGRQAARTVRQYEGSDPVYGTVTATTNENEFGRAVARFMDARVEGVGTEDLMCCQAPGFYNGFGGLYILNKAKVISYVARFDHYVNSASAQLIVSVHYADGKTRDELIIAEYPDSTVTLAATPQVSSACTGCD